MLLASVHLVRVHLYLGLNRLRVVEHLLAVRVVLVQDASAVVDLPSLVSLHVDERILRVLL